MVERQALNNNDWEFAEDIDDTPGELHRSLINPSAFDDPEEYMGTDWVDAGPGNCPDLEPDNDFCGIHSNAGVQNHWFYILATGDGVNGIGMDNAARIAYRSMTKYMNGSSDYEDAREAAIRAARALFGHCSEEHIATVNAWNIVGVGDPFNADCLTVYGPQIVCIELEFIDPVLTAYGQDGASFTWSQIPSNWTTHTEGSNNEHLVIDDFGSQNVPVIEFIKVQSSFGGTEYFEVKVVNCHDGWPRLLNCMDTTGVDAKIKSSNENQLSVGIYPNPATDRLTIKTNRQIENGAIEIYSISGRKLDQYPMSSSRSKTLKLDL